MKSRIVGSLLEASSGHGSRTTALHVASRIALLQFIENTLPDLGEID